MAKGQKRRKATYFKKNHSGSQRVTSGKPSGKVHDKDSAESINLLDQSDNTVHVMTRRLPKDIFDKVINTSGDLYSSFSTTGQHFITQKLLRPSSAKKEPVDMSCEGDNGDLNTYRLFHLNELCTLFNKSFTEHGRLSKNCKGLLVFDMSKEEKWGLSWKETLCCSKCSYQSESTKLYTEINVPNQRGRKAASINYGLQVGLSNNSIGNAGIKNILQSINVPPPCLSGMQKNANKVGYMLQDLNQADMNNIRQTLQEVSRQRGQSINTPINIEADTRYNNRLNSGVGKTPFQPATQATLTIVENHTPHKKVIGVHTASKLCSYAINARKYGVTPNCPNHDGICTANVNLDEAIGNEEKWAYRAYKDILEKDEIPLQLADVTTDGDSTIIKGVIKAAEEKLCNTDIANSRCTRHLSESQKRAILRTEFSKSAFPGKNNKERDHFKRLFALDLKYRCQSEFNCAQKMHKGDLNKMVRTLSFSTDAIIDCYDNKCGNTCAKYSLVCGGNKTNQCKHPYYNTIANPLNLSADDKTKLRALIGMRLSRKALLLTYKGTTTQKTEAINRAYNKVNPKDQTFSRNFSSRIHSGIHCVNNGSANSLVIKCKAVGAPITTGSKVARSLRSSNLRERYCKKKSMSHDNRIRRAVYRQEKYSLHQNTTDKMTYKKDANLRGLKYGKINPKRDHTYSKSK